MKIVIWFIVIFIGTAINNAIGTATGVKAGPLILYPIIFVTATAFCKSWDEKDTKTENNTKTTNGESQEKTNENQSDLSVIPEDAVFVEPTIDKTTGYIVCPECKKTQQQGRRKCFNCGVYFGKRDEFQQNKVGETQGNKCPYCGFSLLPESESCSVCGKVITNVQEEATPLGIEKDSIPPIEADNRPESSQNKTESVEEESAVDINNQQLEKSFAGTESKELDEASESEEDSIPDIIFENHEMQPKTPELCPACGGPLLPNAAFCGHCGMKIAIVEETYTEDDGSAENLSLQEDPKPVEDEFEAGQAAEVVGLDLTIQLASQPAKLRRAFIFLEEGAWDKADEYLESILDEAPENPYAYIGKLMIEKKAMTPSSLTFEDMETSNYYKYAVRYADAELKEKLQSHSKAGQPTADKASTTVEKSEVAEEETKTFYFMDLTEMVAYSQAHPNEPGKVIWARGNNYIDEVTRGCKFFEQGQYQKAIDACSNSLKWNPVGLVARFEMCEAYLAMHNTSEAKKVLRDMEKYLLEKSKIAQYYRRFGYLFCEEGCYECAYACYDYSKVFAASASADQEMQYIKKLKKGLIIPKNAKSILTQNGIRVFEQNKAVDMAQAFSSILPQNK